MTLTTNFTWPHPATSFSSRGRSEGQQHRGESSLMRGISKSKPCFLVLPSTTSLPPRLAFSAARGFAFISTDHDTKGTRITTNRGYVFFQGEAAYQHLANPSEGPTGRIRDSQRRKEQSLTFRLALTQCFIWRHIFMFSTLVVIYSRRSSRHLLSPSLWAQNSESVSHHFSL